MVKIDAENPYSYDSRKCIDIIFLIILIISDYGKHAVHELCPDSIQDRHFILSFGDFPFSLYYISCCASRPERMTAQHAA
ncbi:hypothetical protein Barb4_00217 [Bacteroidales bacterium Barb4]|nr:hypothetical protein Barb4_00217 [Bacteroidales bacterium Barb4]